MLPFARRFGFCRLLAAACFSAVLPAGQQPGELPPAAGTGQAVSQTDKPFTGEERLRWFAGSTTGLTSLLLAGPLSAGWGTLRDSPEEYGRTWKGFGQRYGMRLTGVATSNAIEALSGAVLREDPRYIPARAGTSFRGRARHVLISTFTAYRPDGSRRLSYSRIAGNVGSNFLSNTWRVESDSSARDASLRCVWGLGSRMSSFAFSEFWPVLARRLLRK